MTWAWDVNLSHGSKSDISVLIASEKHQGYVRAADIQPSLTGFVLSCNDLSVMCADCLFTVFLVGHSIPLSVSSDALCSFCP